MSFFAPEVKVEDIPVTGHILNRVFRTLPTESGLPLVDVEDEGVFVSARDALMKIAQSGRISDIVKYSVEILDKLNKEEDYLVLKQRSVQSLSSVLIILRLLADLTKANWHAQESHNRRSSVESNFSNQSSNSNNAIGYAALSVDFHTCQPSVVDSTVASKAIGLISRLKSKNTLIQELALINGKAVLQSNLYEDMTTKPLIDQIDSNCETILRFLAASDPSTFFNFTVTRLLVLKHNVANEGEFAPYLELFSMIYLNEHLLLEYLKHLRSIINTFKKSAYRQLVFSFMIKSVKLWIQSRPREYLNATKQDSNVSMEAETLFEEILSLPDASASKLSSSQQPQKQFKSSYKFLAFLLTLFPKSIQEFLHPGIGGSKGTSLLKLKNFGSNKKNKILSNAIKVLEQPSTSDPSDNIVVLESLDFIVFIAAAAAAIYRSDPENVMVEFTKEYYGLASKALVPISSSRQSPLINSPSVVESELMTSLRLAYFSSLCVLNSQELVPQLVNILIDENASLETTSICTSILNAYTTSASFNLNVIYTVSPSMRRIMIRMSSLIKSSSYPGSIIDEETGSIGKNSSSNLSIHPTSPVAPTHYKSLLNVETTRNAVNDNRTSTPSTLSIPKSERLKETTKGLFRHGHSNSQSQVPATQPPANDDARSVDSRESSYKSAVLSREILASAFGIFKKFPHAYLTSNTDITAEEKLKWMLENRQDLSDPIVTGLHDSNQKLKQAVITFMHAFYSTRNISDDVDSVSAAFCGAGIISSAICEYMLNTFSSEPRKRYAFEQFVKMMEYRIDLYSILANHSSFGMMKKAELPYHAIVNSLIEETLLFSLCVCDKETYSLIRRAIKAHSSEYIYNDYLGASRTLQNKEFFQSLIEDRAVATGVVALFKRIKKHFQKITTPTPSVADSWKRIFELWSKFAKSEYSELTQNELHNFRNFAGFLASTAGIFVDLDAPAEIQEEFTPKVESFINQQLFLLYEDSLVTRENAKEILAQETNPKAFPKVIKMIKPVIQTMSEKAESLTELELAVLDLLIVLMKSILDNSDDITLFYISVDVVHLTDLFAKTIDVLPVSQTSLKLRIKIALLLSQIEIHGNRLVLKHAYKVRNGFLRYVYNWFEHAISYSGEVETDVHREKSDHTHSMGGPGLEYVYIDITLESAKALSLLLDSLVLEAPQVLNEEELKFSKARIFSVYFNTFLKALERFSDADKYPISIKHKVSVVSEYIIACLTNLLKSNVDVGLAYALPIGYHTNLAIRISFLKVFTSIVESYERNSPNDERFTVIFRDAFKDSMTTPKIFSAIGKACPASDAPALAACLLSLADSFNQSANLVSCLVEEEISRANSYTDILRRNSFASRSLSAFGRLKGNDYLISTLRPILTEIRDSEAELEVEKIDLDDPEAAHNLDNFMHYLRKLVNVIINSSNEIPIEFKKVCQSIARAVQSKFSNYRIIAVGSFIFLRFFCPAIVSPDTDKIAEVSSRQTQRKFLLLAKVLQNMANGSISSLKWPLLKEREAEVLALNDKITQFLDSIASSTAEFNFQFVTRKNINDIDFCFLHSYLYKNSVDIREEFLKTCCSSKDLELGKGIGERTMSLMEYVGQPTISFGYEIPASVSPEHNSELYEFMSKYSAKDVSTIVDKPFVRHDIAQDGTQLLVFSYSHFSALAGIDEDLALYRIFQVASKMWDQKFSIVIDCTGNLESYMLSNRVLVLLAKLAPEVMHQNCIGITYYNVSSIFFKTLALNFKNSATFPNSPNAKYDFRSGMDDKKIVDSLGLSKETVKCYYDIRVKFNDISIYDEYQKRFVPVTLKIGHEYIQICHTNPQRLKIKGELKEIYFHDIYRLDQIIMVSASETTGVPNEITIKFQSGQTFILSSPKYLEIMRFLYFSKTRNSTALGDSLFKERVEKSVDDLLGQLFNVVFLGLTSSAVEVRSIAYNLLAISQKKFRLDLGRELHEYHEAYFPRDNNSFVVSMSEKLAKALPHITYDFINSFFKVYNDSITPRQRLSAILYVAPWINNIYDHVFRSDDESGPDLVAHIIRNFLQVTTLDPVFLSAFNSAVWSKLCLEERITTILVDDVVISAIDREAEGSDWKSIISLLTSSPTIELCSSVVKRLRDIADIPFPDDKGSYSIASHSNWVEITVLVQVAVSLFFDNLTFAEMFFPDVVHIITTLLDVGPLDLRIACHHLLLNLLQSFLSKKTITEEYKRVIQRTVVHFTSPRSTLLFGLNREGADTFKAEASKFSSRISTMESLVASLLQIVECASTSVSERTLWISKWNRYIIDAAVRKDSVLRGRAMLLLGILSKNGVNDNMVIKMLEMVAEDSKRDISDLRFSYLAACTIFSLSRIVQGLLPDSILFTRLFWLSVAITHSEHLTIYQGGLQFITNCLSSMDLKEKFFNGDVIGTLLKDKSIFGSKIVECEELGDVILQENNFDHVMIHFASRGLQLPLARVSSIQAFKTFFQVRYTNEAVRLSRQEGSEFNTGTLGYLLFLFILLKNNELKEMIEDIDLDLEFLIWDEQSHFPTVLVDFILSDTDTSNLVLLQASIYFKQDISNRRARLRYLQVLQFIGERNPSLLQRIYPEIRPTLRAIIGESSLPNDLIAAFFTVASLADIPDGNQGDQRYLEANNELLARFNLSGIRNPAFSKENTSSDASKPSRSEIMEPIVRRIYESIIETA